MQNCPRIYNTNLLMVDVIVYKPSPYGLVLIHDKSLRLSHRVYHLSHQTWAGLCVLYITRWGTASYNTSYIKVLTNSPRWTLVTVSIPLSSNILSVEPSHTRLRECSSPGTVAPCRTRSPRNGALWGCLAEKRGVMFCGGAWQRRKGIKSYGCAWQRRKGLKFPWRSPLGVSGREEGV